MPQEIQRQRLRHLIASSVLDIWKKETGSVTSVLIEGTICITGQGGRSTVIQLSDRFAGLVPDSGNALSAADGNDVKVSFSTHDLCSNAAQMNASLLAAVAASRTAASFDGSARAQKEKALNKDRNNNQAGVVDAESRRSDGAVTNKSRSESLSDDRPESLDYEDDISEIEIDDEESTTNDGGSGRAVDEHLRAPPAAHSRPRVAKTEGGGSDFEDSAIQDMSISFNSRSAVDVCGTRPASILADSQKTPPSFGKVRLAENNSGLKSSEASSISPSEVSDSQFDSSDLLLSSPQDLTAQVRNVIRQRLMAHKLLSPYDMIMPNAAAAAGGVGGGQAGSDSVAGSMSFSRPQNSPYYHSKLSPQWSTPMHTSSAIKRDSPDLSAAARQLMVSPFSSSTSIAQHHLISPPHITRPPIQMGLPVPSSPAAAAAAAIQFGASLHNLLGVRAAAAAAAAAGTQSLGAAGHTIDLKNRTNAVSSSLPAAGGSEPTALSGTAADDSPSPVTTDGGNSSFAGSEQKIYRCDYCLKTFLFKSKYHEHLPVHTSARPFQCHLCTRTYKYKYDLRVHLRTHLGIPTKSTVCPFCAGRFATNKLLRQHMRDAHSDDQVTPAQRAQLGAAVVAGGVGGNAVYDAAPVTAATSDGMDEDDSNSRCESTVDNHVDSAEGFKKEVPSTMANGQSDETGLNGKVAHDASPAAIIKQSLSPVLASSIDVTS